MKRDLMTSSWPRMTRNTPSLFDDFDQLVESVFAPRLASSSVFHPACDVNETEKHYHISFDMPGVKKDDISIEMDKNQLVVSGERRYEINESEGSARVRHERSYGRFQRTFRLPQTVDGDRIEANYDDGVLEILVPKAQGSQGRKVEIQSSKQGFLSKLLGDKPRIKDAKTSKENQAS